MKQLAQLIYASRANPDFHEYHLPELLKEARLANARNEVTGMLLYIGGTFVQVLEGPEVTVDALYATIAGDRRHTQVALLLREPIAERSFEGWTMDHVTVDPSDAGRTVGEKDFFADPAHVSRMDARRAKLLLWSLRQRPWEKGSRRTSATSKGSAS
jgi:hypothetical protein